LAKGIRIEDLLQGLSSDERQDFVKRVKAEGGVSVSLTVADKRRKRKHRWDSATGRVIAVRFTDSQYVIVSRRAEAKGLSPGEYLKWLATRSHLSGSRSAAADVSRKLQLHRLDNLQLQNTDVEKTAAARVQKNVKATRWGNTR